MKQAIFLILGVSILFNSCSKDDEKPITDKELIPGTWKVIVTHTMSGSDSALLESKLATACDAKEDYIFTKDGKFTFTNFDDVEGGCERDATEDITGVYTYDEASRKLTLNDGDPDEVLYLSMISSNEMQLVSHRGDLNGDEVNDYRTVIFKR